MFAAALVSAILAACSWAGTLQAPAEEAAAKAPAPVPISAFASPLYLDAEPPPIRSLRNIELVHTGVADAARDVTRTHEEALELAEHLVALLRAGEDFRKVAAEYSSAKNAARGAVLGSFPPGLLAPALDAFLFSAEIGDVSQPISTVSGVLVLQRIETYAATRHIHVHGQDEAARKKIESLLERVRSGEDFSAVARSDSEDKFSAPRGGLFTIFERGQDDRLLKEAAFEARIGEIVGPIESPVGFHLIQRVPLEGHDPALRELTMVRVRAILIAHQGTALAGISSRTPQEAEALARELHARILAGEDMAKLAREHNDDLGGKERAGDLGWIHRHNPRVSSFVDRCFQAAPGELLEPVATNLGWALLRREL